MSSEQMSDVAIAWAGLGAALLGIMVVAILVSMAVYIITSLGWMKLYKAAGYEPAWAAWVPFLNIYAMGMFLKGELQESDRVGYILAFYWVAALIPFVGSIAALVGGVFFLVKECQWILKRGGGALGIILLFLFPIALPYVMLKYYK